MCKIARSQNDVHPKYIFVQTTHKELTNPEPEHTV